MGLSPRVRGKPCVSRRFRSVTRVYPRGYGEALGQGGQPRQRDGLSPRVRGSHQLALRRFGGQGLSPRVRGSRGLILYKRR